MKTYATLFVLSCFWLVNCSTKESTLANLPSKTIWQNGDKSITNVLDSIPKVIIKGIKRENSYSFGKSFIKESETELILAGSMSVLGDLNNDALPEFLLENITETSDSIVGWRMVGVYNNSTLQSLTQVEIKVKKEACNGMIGSNESYSFDDTKAGGPYLVLTGSYGYAENGNCQNYQQANGTTYYKLEPNKSWLEQAHPCSIENEAVNLATLYELRAPLLKNLPLTTGYFFDIYALTNKLLACGNDNKDGISHLEKIAGVKAIGSTKKRNDLMPYIEEEFKNINPEMIQWITNNLIPKPTQTQANGLPYQFIYDIMYKDKFRQMSILRTLIIQQGAEGLLKEYAGITSTKQYIESEERIITKDNYKTYGYLENKFYDIQSLFTNAGYDIQFLEPTDYGFFMRRMLDGSDPAIWNLTKSILQQYDSDWYQETFINKKWTGIIEVDSTIYFETRLLSGVDSIILSKEAIPEGIAIENGAGITITCKNGKEVTFTNNTGPNVSESYAEYKLQGYWPKEEMVLIRYMEWEVGSTLLVDLNTGKEEYRNWDIYPSKDGQYMAEFIDEMGYQAILLLKKEESKWIEISEYPNQYITDGFWKESNFYFKGDKQYYTVGELVL